MPRFTADPKGYIVNVPEFKAPEEKPGPCGCEKTVKGWYCPECKKDLEDREVKNGVCATCEKKAVKTDYCVKTVKGEKTPDRARVRYECPVCRATAEWETEFKHKEDCKRRSSAPKKVCSKSGTAPHVTLPKD